jgi:uncharacterized protein (DUF1684 family)
MLPTWLDLYDWRRRVTEMYRLRDSALLGGEDEVTILEKFRREKDLLLAHHPQSPLDARQRNDFRGLHYFPYNASLRQEAVLEPLADAADDQLEADSSGTQPLPMHRAARLLFSVEGKPLELVAYWIDVYGGGLFLPFRDVTCATESYGGGRYLFDTAKGSTFLPLDATAPAARYGFTGGQVLVDFNYAYNPSCAYNSRWVCPLAPRENWLTVPILAGERKYL